MDSLDHYKKSLSTPTNLPWQTDLQLNLETWRLIVNEGDTDQILLQKKPLKLQLDYLQIFLEKAKVSMKKRSQQEILLQNKSISSWNKSDLTRTG